MSWGGRRSDVRRLGRAGLGAAARAALPALARRARGRVRGRRRATGVPRARAAARRRDQPEEAGARAGHGLVRLLRRQPQRPEREGRHARLSEDGGRARQVPRGLPAGLPGQPGRAGRRLRAARPGVRRLAGQRPRGRDSLAVQRGRVHAGGRVRRPHRRPRVLLPPLAAAAVRLGVRPSRGAQPVLGPDGSRLDALPHPAVRRPRGGRGRAAAGGRRARVLRLARQPPARRPPTPPRAWASPRRWAGPSRRRTTSSPTLFAARGAS